MKTGGRRRLHDERATEVSEATLLSRHRKTPLVLTTGDARIIAATAGFERLTGWSSSELAGRCWVRTLAVPARAEVTRRLLVAAAAGEAARFDLEIVTKPGRRLRLDVAVVRRGVKPGRLALRVRGATADGPSSTRSRLYLVRHGRDPWGVVGSGDPAATGACYAKLYGRTSPCDPCPLRPDPSQPRDVVRATATAFELLSARPVGPELSEVTVTSVDAPTLSAFTEFRLRMLAERARLSRRELVVLLQLARGSSPEEVGSELGIATRTVRFHQYNAFEKLGIDSRFDLFRRLL